MPESPCFDCGVKVVHTEDDRWPRCEACAETLMRNQIIDDIIAGRLDVEIDAHGNLIPIERR